MALVSNEPRKASAVTAEPTKLFTLGQRNFQEFLRVVPSFLQAFSTSTLGYTVLSQRGLTQRPHHFPLSPVPSAH